MDDLVTTPYGFRWGPARVERLASIDRGRGEYVIIRVWGSGRCVDVYVSPQGKSIRVHVPAAIRDGDVPLPRKAEDAT